MKFASMIPAFTLLTAIGCSRAHADGPVRAPSAAAGEAQPRVAVQVDRNGYHPPSATVRAGQPLTLVFTRTDSEGCGTAVVFPTLNIRRDLPLNAPIEITFTPAAGTIDFTCGMGMLRGSIVAQ